MVDTQLQSSSPHKKSMQRPVKTGMTVAPSWKSGPRKDQEQIEIKRLAILHAAAQLFNEGGYHATSINELAKRLNVTKPTLYYYVKSKDDILLRIQQQAMISIEPAMHKARNSGCSGLEQLRLFAEQYMVVMTGDFGRCLVLTGVMPLEESSQREFLPAYRSIDQGVRAMIVEGINDGSIRACDPKMAAFTLFGAMHWVASWYKADGQWTPSEIASQIFSIIENGLGAK